MAGEMADPRASPGSVGSHTGLGLFMQAALGDDVSNVMWPYRINIAAGEGSPSGVCRYTLMYCI